MLGWVGARTRDARAWERSRRARINSGEVLLPDVPEALALLRDLKIELVMATGDNRRTAESVAKALGIVQFEAEIEPAGKIHLVETLRRQGKRVAMAGDGIDDAPALAAADVGIAMGTGSDVAIESGSVTLMKSDLRSVATAVHLSRATLRNIRQNLFFAFV